MRVDHAIEAARQWVIAEACPLSGFLGANTAGFANWLPLHATLAATPTSTS